jgi:ABC-type uncharacterized transport system permease subunit
LIADGLGHRNGALFAVGANVGIQQYFAVLSECRAAMVAGAMLELKVPNLPTLGAVVVGNDLDFAVD